MAEVQGLYGLRKGRTGKMNYEAIWVFLTSTLAVIAAGFATAWLVEESKVAYPFWGVGGGWGEVTI